MTDTCPFFICKFGKGHVCEETEEEIPNNYNVENMEIDGNQLLRTSVLT